MTISPEKPKIVADIDARNQEYWQGSGAEAICTFAALPSNINAMEVAMRFATGSANFVRLFGPCGWGKSHLLQAVLETMERNNLSPKLMSALHWAQLPNRNSIRTPILLDETQELHLHPRLKHIWRQSIEHRLRTGRKTLVAWTAEGQGQAMSQLLPPSREWISAQLDSPGIDERVLVVLQIAATKDIRISQEIAKLIARHVNGNGRSVSGSLHRLRMVDKNWTQPQDLLRACGIIRPYLLGHNGWDPRDHVLDAVSSTLGLSEYDETVQEVSCYFMTKEMELAEMEVAESLQLAPGKVYKMSTSVQSQMSTSAANSLINACRNAILSGFEGE